jgi:hypothetical protein
MYHFKTLLLSGLLNLGIAFQKSWAVVYLFGENLQIKGIIGIE